MGDQVDTGGGSSPIDAGEELVAVAALIQDQRLPQPRLSSVQAANGKAAAPPKEGQKEGEKALSLNLASCFDS